MLFKILKPSSLKHALLSQVLTRAHCSQCPRCGSSTLENLSTHAHCWECSYSPACDSDLKLWRELEFRNNKTRADYLPYRDQHSRRVTDT